MKNFFSAAEDKGDKESLYLNLAVHKANGTFRKHTARGVAIDTSNQDLTQLCPIEVPSHFLIPGLLGFSFLAVFNSIVSASAFDHDDLYPSSTPLEAGSMGLVRAPSEGW